MPFMPSIFQQIRQFLTTHRGAKALSLVLAIVAWYAIQGVINNETLVADVPIKIYLPDGWSVLERTADTVDVRLRGAKEDLAFLNRERVAVIVDLRKEPFEGVRSLPLTERHVEAPAGARPLSVRPARIRLSLDRKSERNIAVKAHLNGRTASGLEVESAVCRPAFATVIGPQQKLDKLDVLRTRPITMEGRTRSFQQRIGIDTDGLDWIDDINPLEVEVEVQLSEPQVRRTTLELPVSILAAPSRGWTYTVTPQIARITVEAPPDALDGNSKPLVHLYIDCSEVTLPATYELPLTAHVPDGVRILDITPAAAGVVVEE